MEEFKEARESLRKEIIEAHIFLRTHNQTIPSETLEFIKCAALEKLESGSPKVENTTTPALNLHGVVLRSELLSDFEKWLDRKGNESYCSLPAQYVVDKYKSLNCG